MDNCFPLSSIHRLRLYNHHTHYSLCLVSLARLTSGPSPPKASCCQDARDRGQGWRHRCDPGVPLLHRHLPSHLDASGAPRPASPAHVPRLLRHQPARRCPHRRHPWPGRRGQTWHAKLLHPAHPGKFFFPLSLQASSVTHCCLS